MRRHACAAIPILAACLSNADAFMAGVPVFLVSPRATAAFASAQLPLGLRLRHSTGRTCGLRSAGRVGISLRMKLGDLDVSKLEDAVQNAVWSNDQLPHFDRAYQAPFRHHTLDHVRIATTMTCIADGYAVLLARRY